MLEKIIRWSIKNRVLILIATIMLIVAGCYSILHTPVDAIPDLSDIQVIIKTPYPGQAPQVVEDQVTYPITTAMLTVPGALTVRGFSFFGDSYVYVIFKDGTNPYWARSRVLEYLNQVSANLPAGVRPELGPDATGVGWIYQYALVSRQHHYDLAHLRSIQDWFLKFELQTVPGVAEVATVGGMVKQYQISIDPNKLRAYGLTLKQVKTHIEQSNQEVGGSVIEQGGAEYMVRARGYLNNAKHIRDILVGYRKNGVPIMLHNIAQVNVGAQMRRGIAELNGQGEVVGGIVVMRQGDNALKVIRAVKQKLNQLKKSLPQGVHIIETYNRASLIQRAIQTLKDKLVEELIIVLLVCALFLFHFRSSLVIILTLPIGILVAFIVMHFQGINANIMSLGGIAIAIGAMVDAAIVMLENLHKHIEQTPLTADNRWKVVTQAAIEVGPALFLTLMIVTLSFLPVFTLQGQEGRLFSPLAFTKTYAMAAAAGLSITLVPVLMGYCVRGRIISEQRNPINRALIYCYRPLLSSALKFPKTVILLAVALTALGLLPLKQLGTEFMPPLDEGDIMYMPTTLPGVSIGTAQHLLQQTDKLIKTIPEVKTVFGKIGRADTATDPAPLTMIETVIQLKPKSQWRKGMTTEKIKALLEKRVKLPGLTNAWVMPIKTRIDMLATGIKTPVGIKIMGPNLSEIQKIGTNIERLLKQIPGTASVYAERTSSGRYLNIDIKRRAAAKYGLTIKDIQRYIRFAIGGMNITHTVEGLERYPVNLRYIQPMRDSINKLKNLPIISPSGQHLRLADVAKLTFNQGAAVIKSENARPSGWVLVDIEKTDVGSYVSRAKQYINQHLTLKPGYSIVWSGQYEYMQRAKIRLKWVIPITLIIIMLLLYLNFKRYQEVVIILVTLPMSLMGAVILLYILGYHLSVAVGVGLIALAGVSVEIGVVMLVYLNQAMQKRIEQANDEKRELAMTDITQAIINGSLLRIRPIMMTVLTIIAGLLPIMFSDSAGVEVMQRIAAPMIGGMISTILLALVLIPAVYLLWKVKNSRFNC